MEVEDGLLFFDVVVFTVSSYDHFSESCFKPCVLEKCVPYQDVTSGTSSGLVFTLPELMRSLSLSVCL